MSKLSPVLLCWVATLCASQAQSYNVGNHHDISDKSFRDSTLNIPGTLEQLGLKPAIAQQKFPSPADIDSSEITSAQGNCRHGSMFTVADLIACGAMFEDAPSLRSINHFYDPTRGIALTVPLYPYFAPWNSPDWALYAPVVNAFSYTRARDYFYGALTTAGAQSVRDALWGYTFQSLGQVIHHLQDMAQPQHVRNDVHLDIFDGSGVPPITNPSRYELYASSRDVRDGVKTYFSLPEATPVYPAYSNTLATPRNFWETADGKGIAQFTNRNFVSHGTNFRMDATGAALANVSYSSPIPTGSHDETMALLFAGQTVPQVVNDFCNNDLTSCVMAFYETSGTDQLTGASVVNKRAATYSVFDQDLRDYHLQAYSYDELTQTWQPTQRVFELNRFNFDSALALLIPRAVAYSTGFINYFFRGNMEITPPSAGVYAVVDHSSSACGDPCGFHRLKLKLRNTTPGTGANGEEPIGRGNLVAVVKYHLNNCYQPDLSGEFDTVSFQARGTLCRSTDESIAVSQPVPVNGVPADHAVDVAFDFDILHPIPINASDVSLQVVFRGKLGLEDNAVAVTTKDIAEPNYLAVLNLTDYVFDDTGDHRYHPLGYQGVTSDITYNNVGIGFAGATAPIISLAQFRGGQFARLAFLTDIADLPTTIFYAGLQTGTWTVQPEEFKQDNTTGNQYTRSCSVFAERGLYWEYLYFYHQSVSDHSLGSGRTIAKNASVDGPIGRLASAGQTGPRFAAKYDHDCAVDTSGIDDFSTPEQGPMTPLTAPSALPWTSITF